jgi:hypothetical protein
MLNLLCPTTFLICPFSSKSAKHLRATDPLIFSLSTRTATVMRRYDWTSFWSLSDVALSSKTACCALSLTVVQRSPLVDVLNIDIWTSPSSRAKGKPNEWGQITLTLPRRSLDGAEDIPYLYPWTTSSSPFLWFLLQVPCCLILKTWNSDVANCVETSFDISIVCERWALSLR